MVFLIEQIEEMRTSDSLNYPVSKSPDNERLKKKESGLHLEWYERDIIGSISEETEGMGPPVVAIPYIRFPILAFISKLTS